MKDNVELLMDLIRIPGESCREKRIVEEIRKLILGMGVPDESIKIDDANKKSMYGGEIGNMIITLDGKPGFDRIMFSTHIDTIPIAIGVKPEIDGSRIIDRQTNHSLGGDARAGCVILLNTIRELVALNGEHPPVTFVFFVQEEIGLVGSKNMNTDMLGKTLPTMCFNFDSSRINQVVYSIVGVERLNINVTGIPAHGGKPWQGISAAAIEAMAVAELIDGGWHGEIRKEDKYGTANLGVLRGGKGSNQVMPELYGLLEARTFDPDFRKEIIERWKSAFRKSVDYFNELAQIEQKASVTFSPGPVYESFTLDKDNPAVASASKAICECGLKPEFIDDMGGEDSNNIVAAGIPAVGVGTGCYDAHTEGEYVDIEEFRQCCELAKILATAN